MRLRGVALALALVLAASSSPSASAAGFTGAGCTLKSTYRFQNEGPTDAALYAGSRGTLHAKMLFVDFSDVPHGDETTQGLSELFVPYAQRYFDRVSRGRLALDVTAQQRWYRMPKPTAAYDVSTNSGLTAYLSDAVAQADGDVDFHGVDELYVVATSGQGVPGTRAYIRPKGGGVATADDTELRWGAEFGNDARTPLPDYAALTLVHETGHTLGLPDLYRYRGRGGDTFDQQNQDVSAWDPMSWHGTGAQFLAWHQRKLDWLDDAPGGGVTCVSSAATQARLRPLDAAPSSTDGAAAALAVPTGPSTAYVAEVRRPAGQDARLCDSGVLVYRLDAQAPVSSGGPIVVRAAQPGSTPYTQCGPLSFAPFDRGADQACRFEDPNDDVRVEVLARHADGSYEVRVSPLSAAPDPATASCAAAEPAPPGSSSSSPPPSPPPARPPVTSGGEQPPSVVTAKPLRVRIVRAARRHLAPAPRSLAILASCDAACSMRALATLDLPGRRDVLLRSATRSGAGGARVRLALGLPRRARSGLARALRRHRALTLRLTVSARETDGARTGTAHRIVRLTPGAARRASGR